MDRLPLEVVKHLYGFLPSKDKVATRRISSKFICLFPYLVQSRTLQIKQDGNSFLLTLVPEKSIEQMETVEIISDAQQTDFMFSTKKWVEENGKSSRKMVVSCSSFHYNRFIDIYLKHLISICSFSILNLVNLNDEILGKVRKTFNESRPEFDWRGKYYWIDLHTSNKILTPEERDFMNCYRNNSERSDRTSSDPPGLMLFLPMDFEASDDFWQLGTIRECMSLYLCFECIDHSKGVEIDLGIDDEFVARLVEKRQITFMANGVATVTPTFMKEYIRNYLDGGYVLFDLFLYHKYESLQLEDFRNYLNLCGFVKDDTGTFVEHIRGEPREGRGRMHVDLDPRWFKIKT